MLKPFDKNTTAAASAQAPEPQVAPAPPALPRRLRWHYRHAGAAVLLAAVFLIVDNLPLYHTDIWGHLKFGEYIVTHRQLPDEEPFCPWSDKETPVPPSAWLSQVILYGTYHLGELIAGGDTLTRTAGGVEMLRTLHALLVMLKCGLLLVAFRRMSGSAGLAVLGVGLVLLLGQTNLGVLRPQVFGEVCFATLLLGLSHPVLPLRGLFGLAGVFVLWANLHGSFLIGLIVLLGAALGQMLNIFRTDRFNVRAYLVAPQFRRLTRSLLLSILCVGLFNPLGFGLYGAVIRFGRHPNLADMDEWQRLSWDSSWFSAFVVTLVLIGLTLIAGKRWLRDPPVETNGPRYVGGYPLGHALLMLGFVIKTVLYQRFMPWWIMLMPFLSMGPWGRLAAIWRPAVARKPASTVEPPLAVAARPLLIVLVCVWIAAIWSGLGRWVQNSEPRQLERAVHAATPVALATQLQHPDSNAVPPLAAWLNQRPSGSPPVRVFASETQAEYLLWALPPSMTLPVYTHVHLFTADHWLAIRRVKFGEAGWEAVLDRLGSNLVVVEAEIHPKLRQQLHTSDRWRVLVDELGDARKPDLKSRLLIAARK